MNWPTEPDVVVRADVFDVITDGELYSGKAWRVRYDVELVTNPQSWRRWTHGSGSFAGMKWKLHPDADQVWANYCAALLQDTCKRF